MGNEVLLLVEFGAALFTGEGCSFWTTFNHPLKKRLEKIIKITNGAGVMVTGKDWALAVSFICSAILLAVLWIRNDLFRFWIQL